MKTEKIMFAIKFYSSLLAIVFTGLVSFNMAAQSGTVTIHQDDRIGELAELKNRLVKENKLHEGFTIQLYNGEVKTANDIIKEYKATYDGWPATITYQTPNYRVWVGNFSTRLEADRALIKIQKDFPNAFVLRPDRRN